MKISKYKKNKISQHILGEITHDKASATTSSYILEILEHKKCKEFSKKVYII